MNAEANNTGRPKFGLLAGWGRYPVVVAEALRGQGYDVYCVGLKGHADPVLGDLCREYHEGGLGKLGSHIRYFRRHGVALATMAGKVHKVQLFAPGYMWRHFPDFHAIRVFFPHFISGTQNRKDDTLLGTLVEAFGRAGVTFVPATDYAPELLVKQGRLTRRRLSRAERQDIEFGWTTAKEMGRLDVGQSVAVKGRAVIAVEAVEGTDECIRRAGTLCTSGGFTVVKVAKPNQDMRFDVPAIGTGTIETMARAGGRVLAVEADKTIFLDREQVIESATRHGITIVAVDDGMAESADAA